MGAESLPKDLGDIGLKPQTGEASQSDLCDIEEVRSRLVKFMLETKSKPGEAVSVRLLGQEFNRRIGQHITDDFETNNLLIPDKQIKIISKDFDESGKADTKLKGFLNRVFRVLEDNGVGTIGQIRKLDLNDAISNFRGLGKAGYEFIAFAFSRPEMAPLTDQAQELDIKKIRERLAQALSGTEDADRPRLLSDYYASRVNDMIGKDIPDDTKITELILPTNPDKLADSKLQGFEGYEKIDASLRGSFNRFLRAFIRHDKSITVGDIRNLEDISNVRSLGETGFHAIKTAFARSQSSIS